MHFVASCERDAVSNPKWLPECPVVREGLGAGAETCMSRVISTRDDRLDCGDRNGEQLGHVSEFATLIRGDVPVVDGLVCEGQKERFVSRIDVFLAELICLAGVTERVRFRLVDVAVLQGGKKQLKIGARPLGRSLIDDFCERECRNLSKQRRALRPGRAHAEGTGPARCLRVFVPSEGCPMGG